MTGRANAWAQPRPRCHQVAALSNSCSTVAHALTWRNRPDLQERSASDQLTGQRTEAIARVLINPSHHPPSRVITIIFPAGCALHVVLAAVWVEASHPFVVQVEPAKQTLALGGYGSGHHDLQLLVERRRSTAGAHRLGCGRFLSRRSDGAASSRGLSLVPWKGHEPRTPAVWQAGLATVGPSPEVPPILARCTRDGRRAGVRRDRVRAVASRGASFRPDARLAQRVGWVLMIGTIASTRCCNSSAPTAAPCTSSALEDTTMTRCRSGTTSTSCPPNPSA